MMDLEDFRRKFRSWATAAIGSLLSASGCGIILGPVFAPGTYTGAPDCSLHIVDPTGAEGDDEFSETTTLIVGSSHDFSINGVEVAVGQQVVRSISSADLAFEITRVTRIGGVMWTVEYEPRPTLPGISVGGQLVETYQWMDGRIEVSADADLVITDVSGESSLTAHCRGVLTGQP